MDWVVSRCAGGRTALEIGCGDAALLARVAKAGLEVTGVDSDETGLRLARQQFARGGLRGEFHDDLAAVSRKKFDVVILAEVIEHVDDADALLAAAVKRLSDRGRLVLTTPIRTLEHSPDPHHSHEFWPGELQGLVGKYFEDVQLSRMHPVWLVDLMCVGIGRIRPVAMIANLLRLTTGLELISWAGSPLGVFWTQGVVGTRPRHSASAWHSTGVCGA
jgi:SAM-dependent methyltransferase